MSFHSRSVIGVSLGNLGVGARGRTLGERLEAFEGDLELVLVCEAGGVVDNLDVQKRNDRHLGVC